MVKEKIDKKYYYIIIGLLIISIISGVAAAQESSQYVRDLLEQLVPTLSLLKSLPPLAIFLFIFINNSLKALLVILLGFLFGLFPLYFIYANGRLIGLISALVFAKSGLTLTLGGILPHGIFEITAIIIAASYGLWLGVRFFQTITQKIPFWGAFRRAMAVYARVVLPLLLVAALIETFVTPLIISFLTK